MWLVLRKGRAGARANPWLQTMGAGGARANPNNAGYHHVVKVLLTWHIEVPRPTGQPCGPSDGTEPLVQSATHKQNSNAAQTRTRVHQMDGRRQPDFVYARTRGAPSQAVIRFVLPLRIGRVRITPSHLNNTRQTQAFPHTYLGTEVCAGQDTGRVSTQVQLMYSKVILLQTNVKFPKKIIFLIL